VYGQQAQRQVATKVSGVNVATNLRRDIKLASGLILSGAIKSADGREFSKGHVTAQSGDKQFEAEMTSDSTYSLALPAGTYNLTVAVSSYNFTTFSVLTFNHQVNESVAVTGDTTRDITIPALGPTFTVSGAVPNSGSLYKQGPFGSVFFASNDGKLIVGAAYFGAQYKMSVPAGSYNVFASGGIDMDDKGTEILSFVAATATITRDATLNLALPPLVRVSGSIKTSSGAPFTEAGVSAYPATVFSSDGLGNAYSSPAKNNSTGQYLLYLPMGTYDLSSSTKVDLGNDVRGFLSFSSARVEVRSDVKQDFVRPTLGPIVTISGKVTDSRGRPVAGATIEAVSEKLTGAPTARLQVLATSDDDGFYSLRVYSGQYTITCTPSAN
jgi:hypothetical protein